MCGIWGHLLVQHSVSDQISESSSDHSSSESHHSYSNNSAVMEEHRDYVQYLFQKFLQVQPRGPDKSDFKIINQHPLVETFLGFHRLAIMDCSSLGDQPFVIENGNKTIHAVCNGEIYNYASLKSENPEFPLKGHSDCEILPHLFIKYGFFETLKKLEGEFALVIIEMNDTSLDIYIGRDKSGIRPVFISTLKHPDTNFITRIGFSSILKGLGDIEVDFEREELKDLYSIRQVDQGEMIHFSFQSDTKSLKYRSERYHNLTPVVPFEGTLDDMRTRIFETLYHAVSRRLVADRPLGALLSGGLDSSLVVAIAATELKKRNPPERLHTFSIGMPGSTDKEFAELVAKHYNTIHTHVELSNEEFSGSMRDVISTTETFDTTTNRASTGQLLVSKWISENTDIKVLLIGDGSDELCSGYLYFYNAPSPEAAHLENIRLLQDIKYFDVLRADRCVAGNGLEARVPFLDEKFIELYLSLPPELRAPSKKDGGRCEKWLLRSAFDFNNETLNKPWLPAQVLWRKKEAFSDGVSSTMNSWSKISQERADTLLSSSLEDYKDDKQVQFHFPPQTTEDLYFRLTFNNIFHYRSAPAVCPYKWLPNWSGNVTDPSARVLEVYKSS
jgi:asparagine synthase (glutamine-hydrolysing)